MPRGCRTQRRGGRREIPDAAGAMAETTVRRPARQPRQRLRLFQGAHHHQPRLLPFLFRDVPVDGEGAQLPELVVALWSLDGRPLLRALAVDVSSKLPSRN